MQKQSFELIKNIKKKTKAQEIIFNNKYPIIVFLLISLPWAALKIIKNKNIGVVHANDGLMALFLSPLLLIKRLKMTVTIHGLDMVFRLGLYQLWIRNILSKFDLIIAVSEATRNECITRGISSEKVKFIPNAIDIPSSSDKEDNFINWIEDSYHVSIREKFILTSVGRTIPRKGFSWFLENVFPNISKPFIYLIAGPEIKHSKIIKLFEKVLPSFLFEKYCQFVGIPLDSIKIKKLLSHTQYVGKVIFLGKISNEKLNQLYLHTDLFIMPNLHVEGDFEGFGLVAQEAAVRGALSVVADADGITSAVKNNETGVILPSGNAKMWVDTIRSLLTSQQELDSLGKLYANNIKIDGYTWRKMSEAYLQAFNELLVVEGAISV